MIERPTDALRRYKQNSDAATRFRLPIIDPEGRDLGALVCVDHTLAKDATVIADLTNWRARHMRYFLTQFSATPERTAAWLDKIVLSNDDRILFIIYTEKDEPVDNFGVCNIDKTRGELDNLIRGRKGGHSRLVFYSELAMLAWMFGSLSLQLVNLHVFSNNTKTIELHSSVGFAACRSKKISRLEASDETRFLVDSDEGELVGYSYEEMAITKAAFLRLHPWVATAYPDL